MSGFKSFAALVLLCAAALRAGEAPTPSETGKAPSETLLTQARDMMNEIFDNMKSERRLPPTTTDSELAARVTTNIDMLKATRIFDVTPAQDEAFKKGAFDDGRNLEQLGAMIEYLQKKKIDMPAQTVYAIRHYEAKDLKGARLEMCVRVVNYNVSKLRALLGETEPPAKRSKP